MSYSDKYVVIMYLFRSTSIKAHPHDYAQLHLYSHVIEFYQLQKLCFCNLIMLMLLINFILISMLNTLTQ